VLIGHAMNSAEVAQLTTHGRLKVRRAIGWIAAYALALQTILGGIAPRLAIGSAAFDLAAICLNSHGGSVGTGGDIPDNPGTGSQAGGHCALCGSPPPPLVAPQTGSRVAIYVTAAEVILPPPPVPPFTKVASRPGGPRAPPMTA
jgi:hypothetical protein